MIQDIMEQLEIRIGKQLQMILHMSLWVKIGMTSTDHTHCMPTYDLTIESDFWQGERVWS
ncbi:MAG: hypothetical protein R2883_00140 [Caldisericia bacterium]